MVEIFCLHDIPKSIISDQNPIFLSTFRKELYKLQGTTLKFNFAYHQESDDQTKVTNRSLKAYLRWFASNNPKIWFKYLHLVEYWFNMSYHSTIGMLVFWALYSRHLYLAAYMEGEMTLDTMETPLLRCHQLLYQF